MRSIRCALCVMFVAINAVIFMPGLSALEDPVKVALQEHKAAVCGVVIAVAGLAGPLDDPAQMAWIADQITFAATIGQELLNDETSPLYTTPETWLYWMPIDATNMNLTETAAEACEAACDALEAYCELIEQGGNNPALLEQAAKALWQCQQLFCHLFDAAGIER